jgi:RNA polymerase sigma-70 factor (ECF subfamily)
LETSQAHIHDHLVKKAALGDRKAQTKLYELYCEAMFKVANRIVNDAACAEDLMHESFIDAFQKFDQFQFDSTFGHWLKRIVINKSLNHLRREKMISEKEEELRQISESESREIAEDHSDNWSNRFSLSNIYEASQQLAKKHALVFNLYMIEGYDHEEISEIMGISASTSRSQLSRAKQNLKEILIHQMKQEDVRS